MSSISEEEDSGPSLKELVTKSLEANGVLGKLQAQLRASVFLILEEECQEKNIPLVNQQSLKLLSSPTGKIAVCLIQDFLQCLHLDFTLAVFNPETKNVSSDISINREILEDKFNVKLSDHDKNYPFLLRLVEDIVKQQQEEKTSKQEDTHSSQSADSSKLSNGVTHTGNDVKNGEVVVENDSLHSKKVNGHGKEKYDEYRPNSDEKIKSHTHNGIHDQDSEKEEVISPGLSESSSLSEKDTLAGLEKEYEEEGFSSLSNANNIDISQENSHSGSEDADEKHSKKATAVPELNGQSLDDKSEGLSKGSDVQKSISEDIEEIDDLLSTNSEVSNHTKDITVSNKDNNVIADYQESL